MVEEIPLENEIFELFHFWNSNDSYIYFNYFSYSLHYWFLLYHSLPSLFC